jgi:signal transduction histidine kinase
VASSQLTESIERSLRRVGTLLDDALVSIRLEEQDALTYEDFQVRELLAQLVNDSAAEAAAKAETIVIEGSACAHADRRSLASALSNLLRNAVKFTKPGGSIHLRVKEVDCRIMIEVEDGCGGLPGGTVHKLFDPFVQAGADRSGFGLGLAIAEQATEAHGGTLRVHDLPGRGCVFVLDIPAAPARQAG